LPKVIFRKFTGCITVVLEAIFHWYLKTPLERLKATEELWRQYLEMGGSLDPDPDPESPFWNREEIEQFARNAARTKERAFQNTTKKKAE